MHLEHEARKVIMDNCALEMEVQKTHLKLVKSFCHPDNHLGNLDLDNRLLQNPANANVITTITIKQLIKTHLSTTHAQVVHVRIN